MFSVDHITTFGHMYGAELDVLDFRLKYQYLAKVVCNFKEAL